MHKLEAKDLFVDSYVTSIHGYLYQVKTVNSLTGKISAWRLDTGKLVYTVAIDELAPLNLHPILFPQLGWTNSQQEGSDDLSYSWQWNDDFRLYNYEAVRYKDQPDWCLICDTHFLCRLTGVHHLQATIWHLEREWLAFKP